MQKQTNIKIPITMPIMVRVRSRSGSGVFPGAINRHNKPIKNLLSVAKFTQHLQKLSFPNKKIVMKISAKRFEIFLSPTNAEIQALQLYGSGC